MDNRLQTELQDALGIIGNITSMALFLSPLPTFVRIFKLKSTEEFSAFPYVCTLLNCMLWVLFGMPIVEPNSLLIVTINGFGFVTEFCFVSLYLTYATKPSKIRVLIYLTCVAIIYTTIVLVTLLALHTHADRQKLVGSLCIVFGAGMYASPLSIMGLVIRTKSVEFMPFTLSLCNFLNSAIWTTFAFVTHDIFVLIPNGLGCVAAIMQLVLYGIYYKNTKIMLKERKQPHNGASFTMPSIEKDIEKNSPAKSLSQGENGQVANSHNGALFTTPSVEKDIEKKSPAESLSRGNNGVVAGQPATTMDATKDKCGTPK